MDTVSINDENILKILDATKYNYFLDLDENFMKKVKSNDKKAMIIFNKILSSQRERGMPHIIFSCNIKY